MTISGGSAPATGRLRSATDISTDATEAVLLGVLRAQRETADARAMMRMASQAVAGYLGANRAGFLETDGGDFVVDVQWDDGVLPALSGRFGATTLGIAYLAEIRRGTTIATDDLDTDPLTADSLLRRAGVRASIGSPIFRDGAWRGGLFVHQARVRHWSEADAALVREVADHTWDAVERARSLAALADSHAFTRLLLDSTSEAFYAVDTEGRATLCNAAFLAMLGFAGEDEVVGRRLHDMIHHTRPDGSHYPPEQCPIQVAATAGTPAQVADEVFFRTDGTSFPVEYRAAPIRQDGQVRGAICTFVDITERRRAELALRQLNETLEARVAEQAASQDRLWRNSQDLQVVVDREGIFQAVNPACAHTLGWTADEMVGHPVFDFIVVDSIADTEDALDRASQGSLPVFLNQYRHKDGGTRWISWVATTEAGLIYASGRHVTAEKEAEAQLELTREALRQAHKMEAVGQLTGGIAHDFNNLLTVIIGSQDLLAMRMEAQDAKSQRLLAAAQDGARRAAQLTQRLLAFARRQPLRPEAVDLNALLAGMADLLRTSAGAEVVVEFALAPDAWWVEVDVSQLENVVLNLAVNARDAMPEGGRLTLTTANVGSDDAVPVPGMPAGENVRLSVADTGCGMPAEVMANAFDPFFTTKGVGKGTGLGLSQVYGFVRQSGGDVAISSVVGCGTTVRIDLPRLQR